MALGSVSTAPFTKAELSENFGTVSIVPCTRAEIVKMFKQKMYPNGKLTSSGTTWFSYNDDSVIWFSADTDYVVLTCMSDETGSTYTLPNGTKLTRGKSISTPGNRYYCTISFNSDGSLWFTGYFAQNKSARAYYLAEGYHYY